MDKFAKMALLADFYGPLLTEKQRNVWDLHYQQDLSLSEIAEVEEISRQAVHDLLKRTERILLEYEEKLGLVDRFLLEREKLQAIQSLMESFKESDFASTEGKEICSLARQRIAELLESVNL
ncbi:MAG: putative DNA-binding protein [Desulfitobacterium hafniense]|nr:putative DNA-binding protein [Desulfitobacterium hafniense]